MSARTFAPADLPVSVSSWEIECCGPLPTVGGPASWRLIFSPVATPDLESLDRVPGSVSELEWLVEPWPDGGDDARALYRNGFAAYFYRPMDSSPGQRAHLPPPGRQMLRGVVFGTRHGGSDYDLFPTVAATVHRIQVVSCEYRLQDDRTLVPVVGTTALREVQQSPKWFHSHHPRQLGRGDRRTGQRRRRESAEQYRNETGVLLTLRDTGAQP